MVYLIQAGGSDGPVKIGYSKTVASALSRLALFQPGCPLELRLVRVVDGDKLEEQALHLRFARQKIHGEWFAVSEELLGLGRPPDETEPAAIQPVSFRWDEELLARVDEARGLIPRSAFVREAVERALGDVEPRSRKPSSELASAQLEGRRDPAPAEQPQRFRRQPGPDVTNIRSSAQARRDVRPIPKSTKR